MRLQDKVVLITGGGGGMGRACALACAREQAAVVVVDRHEEAARDVAAQVVDAGGRAHFLGTDVSNAAEVRAMADEALAHFGALHAAFLNAAIQPHDHDAPAAELDEAIWDAVMNVNLRGVWLCAKALLPALLATGGSLVLAGSPTGLTAGGAGYTAYSASKGGVAALTRVMAADYGRRGVRVNMLVPGPIETPLTHALFQNPAVRGELERLTLLGRLGQPEDVTGLLVFLASDESRYCTGGFYMADGGITAL